MKCAAEQMYRSILSDMNSRYAIGYHPPTKSAIVSGEP